MESAESPHVLKVLAPAAVFVEAVNTMMMDTLQKLAGMPPSEMNVALVQFAKCMGSLSVQAAT